MAFWFVYAQGERGDGFNAPTSRGPLELVPKCGAATDGLISILGRAGIFVEHILYTNGHDKAMT